MLPAVPPDPAPLEVDRVEWLPATPQAVRVHLLGRWSDRPVSGALLLVGDGGRRHGFEPLADTPAGVLLAFEVPNELRPALELDIALQIGSSELALPSAVAGDVTEDADDETGQTPEAGRGEVIDRAVLAERRARRAELSEDAVTRRAEAAERTASTLSAQLGNLERRLEAVNDERHELEAQSAELEQRLRAAEQREYAEQQLRIDTQDELGLVRRVHEAETSDLRERLESVTRRAEELAREVDRARRATAEAVQRGDAERTALRRAEAELAQRQEAVASSEDDKSARERLDAALAGERAERERLERLLDESRSAAQAELKRLEYELSARREAHAQIIAELSAAQSELQQLRDRERQRPDAPPAPAPQPVVPDAAVSALEQRIVALEQCREETRGRESSVLRELLDARSAELEHARLDLRRQLIDVIAGLRDAAEADRSARSELERQLLAREHREAELQRLVADVLRTSAALRARFEIEIRELEARMTERLVAERAEAAEQLDAAQRKIADLEARVLTADDVRAGQDLTLSLRAEAESLRSELARVRAVAEAQREGRQPGDEMVGGLDAAAARLRQAISPFDDVLEGEPSIARRTPREDEEPAADASAAEPVEPTPFPARTAVASAQPSAWLARSIGRMALIDPEAASRLVVALLPALRPEGLALSFDIAIDEDGRHRVTIRKDGTTVERLVAPSARGSVAFRLSGPAKAFATFAGGGMRRRPRELQVAGRKRRLRKLVKQLRQPLGLADLRDAGVDVDPGVLLAALSAAIEPEWTFGSRFTIVWKVSGGHAGTWHVSVRPGAVPRVAEGLPEADPDAIVYVTEGGLIPLLGGLELPVGDAASVVGDAAAVTTLREWFDSAQGLA